MSTSVSDSFKSISELDTKFTNIISEMEKINDFVQKYDSLVEDLETAWQSDTSTNVQAKVHEINTSINHLSTNIATIKEKYEMVKANVRAANATNFSKSDFQ